LLDDAPVVGSAKTIPPLSVGLEDAAKLIGISGRTLWTMVDRGEVPHVKLGGRLLFRVESLDKWLEEREQASSKPPRDSETGT
jgi:excisionase family DNA binding protein